MSTEAIVFLCSLPFLGWIYYQLQKRIGEDQAREWKEYVAANPHLFRKPEPVKPPIRLGMTEEQKKSM